SRVRSYWLRLGTTMSAHPRACRARITCCPRNPAPPVTTIRLSRSCITASSATQALHRQGGASPLPARAPQLPPGRIHAVVTHHPVGIHLGGGIRTPGPERRVFALRRRRIAEHHAARSLVEAAADAALS